MPRPPRRRPRSLAGIEGTIQRLQASLDRVEARQTAALNSLEESYDGKVKRMRGVLADLGINPGKVPPPSGVGGPFVPVKLPANAGTFERQLFRINVARTQAERLSYTLGTVPVRKPIVGEIDLSSSFGVRSDPFGRGPAMHSGLDFRASHGDPVRATANGKVVSAGWNGGYGKMVEIDHGNDITTRYGHLSDIEVKVGQTVRGRPDHRPHRLDRPFDRSAPALRDADRRRRGRSAEVPACRVAPGQRALIAANARHG